MTVKVFAFTLRGIMSNFTHLHLHTAYSLLDSTNRIESIADRIKEMGQTAAAITDHGTLAGAVKFTDAMKKRGLKPILGMEAYIAPDSRHRHKYPRVPTGEFDENGKEKMKDAHSASHLILLAKTAKGWDNLRQLSTLSYLEGFYKKPRIDHETLERYSEGLIATTACMGGDISVHLKAGLDVEGEGKAVFDPELAEVKLAWYVSVFGPDFYIELQEHGEHSAQRAINDWYRERYPAEMIFASADAHYLIESDYDVHDILLCCNVQKPQHDPNRWRFPTDQAWLKSTEEMLELFSIQEVENTMKIADSVEFELPLRKQFYMPELPADILEGNSAEYKFRNECIRGLERRLGLHEEEPMPENYAQRLDYEMEVFINPSKSFDANFVTYALILWDLMDWCARTEIFTGDGRGSGAGSLVLYALGIVNVDPILRDCPFERFINPGRLQNFAPPDVDLDFPKSRRQDVIAYLRERYGEENVVQIGTYASLGPAGIIRKLAIPLGIDHSTVSKLTSIIPEGEATQQGSGAASEVHGLSLDDVWKQSETFRHIVTKMGDQGKWLLHYARGLRNLGTHASTHASGILITDRPAGELVPLMTGKGDNKDLVLAQFDMFDVEAMGCIKYDILGLDTLDVLAAVQQYIRDFEDASFSFDQVDLDDPAAYALLSSGRTMGIFQASGGGFGRLLPQSQPRSVEDLAVLTSLCRPGPSLSGATATYLRRRQGLEPVTYPIPQLESILGKNEGVLAFQEDIMAIAHQLAGFSLSEADELRKVMGKKQIDKMPKYQRMLVDGLEEHSGISPHEGEKLWEQLVPMAQYVFNRSHAMAYSYTTAKCAWGKAHYPAYFLAAAMSADSSGTNSGANLPALVRDAQYAGCVMVKPNINTSQRGFTPLNRTAIQLGLLSIRGVGEAAATVILAEREANGPFESIEDWRLRVPARSANALVQTALERAGAFGETQDNLADEFELFGFYLTDHQCARMRPGWLIECPDLETIEAINADDDKERKMIHTKFGRKPVWQFKEKHLRAIVTKVTKKKSKRDGSFMLMIEVEDETGGIKLIINAKQLIKFESPSITKGATLDMRGRKSDPTKWLGYFEPSSLSVL